MTLELLLMFQLVLDKLVDQIRYYPTLRNVKVSRNRESHYLNFYSVWCCAEVKDESTITQDLIHNSSKIMTIYDL